MPEMSIKDVEPNTWVRFEDARGVQAVGLKIDWIHRPKHAEGCMVVVPVMGTTLVTVPELRNVETQPVYPLDADGLRRAYEVGDELHCEYIDRIIRAYLHGLDGTAIIPRFHTAEEVDDGVRGATGRDDAEGSGATEPGSGGSSDEGAVVRETTTGG